MALARDPSGDHPMAHAPAGYGIPCGPAACSPRGTRAGQVECRSPSAWYAKPAALSCDCEWEVVCRCRLGNAGHARLSVP